MKKSIEKVLENTRIVLDIIQKTELTDEEKGWISETTVRNFNDNVNPGFLKYRKSVSNDYTAIEWSDHAYRFRDIHGREYIDCLGGYGTLNMGHRHPKIVAAVKAQLDRQAIHSQELLDPLRGFLSKLLADITPGDLQYSFLTSSGTEAVEGALKLSRLHTGRLNYIAAVDGFHGKSMGSLGATAKAVFRKAFLPLVPAFHHVPFGDLSSLEKMLWSLEKVGEDVAAVLLEPIQGEGGVILPPDDYLQGVRALCNHYGCLLILDEIQTGMGRTGKLWASEHWGVIPDILCIGKSFGGGIMPAGAFMSNAKIWQKMIPNPFLHSSTFGGNPLACAAAIAAIHVTLSENLPEKAASTGAHFLKRLQQLSCEFPDILSEVRGKGLMIGMEFPDDDIGFEVAKGLFERGVLVAGTMLNARVIRIEPPLAIPRDDVNRVLELLYETLLEVQAGRSMPAPPLKRSARARNKYKQLRKGTNKP
ncbi:MAG: putrescine aminotransferase [Bacteroidota bacterium]